MLTSIRSPPAEATSQIVTLPCVPELFNPNFLDILIPATQDGTTPKEEPMEVPSNDMVDALRSTAHQKLTTNNTPTFSSTLVSTFDAYLGLRRGVSGEDVDGYLEDAWAEDPNLTLRIIWGTSIHHKKGEKELFYRTFGWLFTKHPRTAITNLNYLVDPVCLTSDDDPDVESGASHRTWKDLLDILALVTVDELGPRTRFKPRSNFLYNFYDKKSDPRPAFKNNEEQEEWSRAQRIKRTRRAHENLAKKLLDKRYRALYVAVARLFAAQLAKESDIMDKVDALQHPTCPGDRIDLIRTLTLTSNWAPTPGGSHDRITNISSAICLLLHAARMPYLITQGLPSTVATEVAESEMHILRSLYQRHVVARGRRFGEWLACWPRAVYSRVASTCMDKHIFMHEEERLLGYLEDVESGKGKISGVTFLPHLLAKDAFYLFQQDRRPAIFLLRQTRLLAEALVDTQWATLVGRLRESGQLDNSIAICDVSEFMGFIDDTATRNSPFNTDPIWPAISLSLLVAQLAKPPFQNAFITFDQSPQLVAIHPEDRQLSLGAMIDSIHETANDRRLDFNAVSLELILPFAIEHRVPKDEMIKRIFVFTNMQFDKANPPKSASEDTESMEVDAASESAEIDDAEIEDVEVVKKAEDENRRVKAAAVWKTNHDVIAEAYAQAGYDVPELVYWDLSPQDGHGITAPVTGDREGVTLLRGYSLALLKVFMDVEEEEEWDILDEEGQPKADLTLVGLMKKVLGGRRYDGLVVVD